MDLRQYAEGIIRQREIEAINAIKKSVQYLAADPLLVAILEHIIFKIENIEKRLNKESL